MTITAALRKLIKSLLALSAIATAILRKKALTPRARPPKDPTRFPGDRVEIEWDLRGAKGLEAATDNTSPPTKDLDFNPCPNDTRRTTSPDGDVECVCEPCAIPECQGNILPTVLREAAGVPGRCCPKYDCPPAPGGRSVEPSDEHKDRCLLAGKSYGLNTVWKDKDDPCKECRCEEKGKIRCQTPMCRSNCAKPVLKEGQCCPVCDEEGTGSFSRPNTDCPHPVPNETTCELVRNKRCKDGLVVDDNGCVQCACKNGEVSHIPPLTPPEKPEFEIDDPECSGGLREYCLDATTRCTCTYGGKGEQAICTSVARCEPSPHYQGEIPPKVEPPKSELEARDALCKDGPREYCWNSTTKCICDKGRANCTSTSCTSSHPFVEDTGYEWNSTLVAVIAVLAALCVILSVCLIRQCRHRRQTMSPHTVDIIGIPAPQRNLNLNLKSYFALPTT